MAQMKCSYCEGTGIGSVCRLCNGEGMYYKTGKGFLGLSGDVYACSVCKGTGDKRPCSRCKGTGYIDVPDRR